MANRWSTQFVSTLHKKLAMIDCEFMVAPASLNGAGVSGLKGAGVFAVYMNTTASFVGDTHTSTLIDGIASTANLRVKMRVFGSGIPVGAYITSIDSATAIHINVPTTTSVAAGTITYTAAGSPNPAAGYIEVVFQDNWNYFYNKIHGFQAPLSGSNISISAGLTVGVAYTIVSLGTTTTDQWVAVGVPIGTVPVVGLSFIASSSAPGGGTGVVQTSTSSGVASVEVVSNPQFSITSHGAAIVGQSSGAYMILKCLDYAGALVAPATGSVMDLSFFFSNSLIQVNGD